MNKIKHGDWIDIEGFNRTTLYALKATCEFTTGQHIVDGRRAMVAGNLDIQGQTLFEKLSEQPLNRTQWLFNSAPDWATMLVRTENAEYVYLNDTTFFWPIYRHSGQPKNCNFTTIATRELREGKKTVNDAVAHYKDCWHNKEHNFVYFNKLLGFFTSFSQAEHELSPDEYLVCTKDQFNEVVQTDTLNSNCTDSIREVAENSVKRIDELKKRINEAIELLQSDNDDTAYEACQILLGVD